MTSGISDNALNLADERPLYKQIEHQLENYIRHNDLAEGSLIPSLRILADKFSTNELTVRRAIRGLVDREILVTRQGRGTFVNFDATRRKVLWVCGVGVEDGEVSPFYQLVLRRCHQFCEDTACKLHPVWIGENDTAASRSFCNHKKIGEYAGYVFVGCRSDHPILKFVRENNLKHVLFSHDQQQIHRGVVSADYQSAVRLGLEHFQQQSIDQITIVELQDTDSLSRQVAQTYALDINLIGLPHQSRLLKYEQMGYLLGCQLLKQDRLSQGVFILDDIVAKGMTRAILQAQGKGQKNHEIIIISAKQAIAPAGLPVTYIVHDADEMAQQAMQILANEIQGRIQGEGYFISPYSLYTSVSDSCDIHLEFEVEKLSHSSRKT
ncbi:MAG: GntR family transcriptional regulator [Phycisphaeraceae bacterium JB051]